MTPDGGVALTFDNLESSMDEECLEQLHNAIDNIVEEQNQVVPSELEKAVAKEVQVRGVAEWCEGLVWRNRVAK